MPMSQRSGLLSGVLVLACATILLESTLARLYAALFGEPFAFPASALSLVGAAGGGLLVYLAPSLVRPGAVVARMAVLSALASGAVIGATILLAHVGPIERLDPPSLLWLALAYAASAVPFVLSGAAFAAAVRHVSAEAPRLYLLALAGGAAGALAAALAIRAGAPRAALSASILFALAAVAFALGARREAAERRAPGALCATFLLGSCVLLAGDLGAPWLKPAGLRRVSPGRVELEAWSDRALITVDRARGGTAWMRLDGTAARAILDAKTAPPPQPDDMAYALHRERGPVLVVGAGGGRDLRAALKAGQKEIHAVEERRGVVELMRGRYAEFSDRVYDRPEVRVVASGGRRFARRDPLLYRHIVIPSADIVAASASGALALSESFLLTVEGASDLLARLAPEGTLVVSGAEGDFDRLLALAAAALRRSGAAEPKEHLFACGSSRSIALLVKRTPLERADVGALRRHCQRYKFPEAFAPDRARTALRGQIVAAGGGRVEAPAARADLTPPTDDRPFFFYDVPPRRLAAALGDLKALRTEHTGLLAVLSLLAVGAALAALCLLAPPIAARLAARRRASAGAALPAPADATPLDAAPPDAVPPAEAVARPRRALLFFASIGAGFALFQLAAVRHADVLLDPTAYAPTTALVILLVSAGAGALLTARVSIEAAAPAAARCAALLVAAAALAAVGLGPLVRWSLGLAAAPGAALAALSLAPIGALMGALAPLGIKLVAKDAPALLPLCLALSAAAGAAATAGGLLVAMNLGYGALLLGAGLAFLLAAMAALPASTAALPAPASEPAR